MRKRKIYSLRWNWVESKFWADILDLSVISEGSISARILDDIREYDLGRIAKKRRIPLIEVYFQEFSQGRIGQSYYVKEGISTVRAFLAFREGAKKVPLVVLGEISGADLKSVRRLSFLNVYNVGDLEKVLEERSK